MPFLLFRIEPKKSVNQRKYLDLMQVCDKQRQAGSTGQTFAGHFNFANFQFLFSVRFAMFLHQVLHLIGMAILVNAFVGFNKYYSILSSDRGLYFA